MLHYPTKKYNLLIVLLFLVVFASIGYSDTYEHFPSTSNDTWADFFIDATEVNAHAIDAATADTQDPSADRHADWWNTSTVSSLGTINSVHVSALLKTSGTTGNDYYQIWYKSVTTPGACGLQGDYTGYQNVTPEISTVIAATYFNVTDAGIGWADLDNICFRVEYQRIGGDENFEAQIDALWIKVDYTPTAPPGGLNVTLWNPAVSSINVTQDNTTIINASVVCLDGDCNDVNATFWYNFSNNNYPNVLINTTQYDKPFYNFSGAVIQLCGDMVENDQCNVSIVVNATGYNGSSWYLNVTFNSSDSLENSTSNFQLNISPSPAGPEPAANTAPNISAPVIISAAPEAWDTLNCSAVASDDENVTLYVNFTWESNGTIDNSYNYLQTCSNSTVCYQGILVPNTSTSAYDVWNCRVQAWDAIPPAGLNSGWNETSVGILNITTNNVTVFDNPDPVNVTLDAKFQANYTDDNDNPIVNVSVCNIDFQIGGSWVGAEWMDWNATSEMYEYTRSFPNVELVNVSTVCWEINYQEQRNSTDITVQAGPTTLRYTIETVNASNENYSIITYPGNDTLDIWFNVTDGNQKYVLPCIETGTPPSAECQNTTNPIMRFTNVGTESFNITMRLNFSMIGNITVFANFSNYTSMADCSGWSLASNNSIIGTTPLNFTRAMCVGNVTDVWLYANFTDYSGDIVENFFNYSSNNV